MQMCLVCQKRAYSDFCVQHKPRKPLKSKSNYLKRAKALKQTGKHYDIWKETKSRWWLRNGAGPHSCHYCGVYLDKTTLTLDHLIPRSRAPQLRYKCSNLVPCCMSCNGRKGSVDHDSYPHECHS